MPKAPALLILSPGFAAYENDSTCLPMQQLFVKNLQQLYPRYKIYVLAFHYPFRKSAYHWNGVQVLSFNGRNRGRWYRLFLDAGILRALETLHREHDIQGVISFWYGESAAIGSRFASKYELPFICWISGQDARPKNEYPRRLRLPAHQLAALSDFLQQEFARNHGTRPAYVIPPGMNDIPLREGPRTTDILGVGSLIPLKQFTILIEMVAALKKEFPRLTCKIVGQGPELKTLQNLLEKYRLDEQVELTGALPHEEVLLLMQRSKLLLHPSAYEGFSGVCMEALAAGMHVISFTRAMDQAIQQWHVVDSKAAMREKAAALLSDASTRYEPVHPFTMQQTVNEMMALLLRKKSN